MGDDGGTKSGQFTLIRSGFTSPGKRGDNSRSRRKLGSSVEEEMKEPGTN